MRAHLGIDLGTSGLKALVLAGDGAVVAEAECAYDLDSPRAGWAEIDPAVWERALWDATAQLGDALAAVELRSVGLSGQMHAAVLVDVEVRPVRPAILWPDTRAVDVLDAWRALPDAALAALASPIVAGMTGPALRWVADHEPDTFGRAATVLGAKDLLRHRLVPVVATERSDACATLLWDVPAERWSAPALAAAQLPDAMLPPLVAPDAVVGVTDALARRSPGVTSGVPVAAGGADTPLALAAVRAIDGPDPAGVVNLGTGAQVLVPDVRADHVPPTGGHVYADTADGWYAMAALRNGGLALEWARTVLGRPWRDFIDAAAASPAGARGVTFHPFLGGERGGVASPTSTGAWTGLTPDCGPPELARAAIEGVVFAVAHVVAANVPPGPLRLGGGLGREPLVHTLLATITGRAVQRVELRSASAVGAALLGARAVGDRVTPRAALDDVSPLDGAPAAVVQAAYERWTDRLAAAER
ncbi:MAG: FGGY family carbohydrate kinase [Actinomycetota bacterium]|nr:FGGY family carbohydrate kinase [Actinomycetota bacterium]